MSHSVLASLLAVPILSALVSGQNAVHLTGVPEQLTLPVRPDRNALITAHVPRDADAIWLARDRKSSARFHLARTADGKCQIDLGDPQLVAVLAANSHWGEFRVFAERRGGGIVASPSVRFVMREKSQRAAMRAALRRAFDPTGLDKPDKLDLFGSIGRVTVVQRERALVPGSNRYLRVHVGDITAGQTLVALTGANGEQFIPQRSMRAGDHAEFRLGDQQYTLRVDRLMNLLIGDDFAELSIGKLGADHRSLIEALIDRVAATELTFIRNGTAYAAADAAAHLRLKLENGPKISSPEEFIDKIASRSSISGKPYQVKLGTDKKVAAAAWLREQLAELRREVKRPAVKAAVDKR